MSAKKPKYRPETLYLKGKKGETAPDLEKLTARETTEWFVEQTSDVCFASSPNTS
jgi:hypothetical protein